MVSTSQDIRNDFKFGGVIGIVVTILFIGSGFALTVGGGVNNPQFIEAFLLYAILGGGGVAYYFGVIIANYLNHRRYLMYVMHEPEDGLFYKIKFIRNPLLLALLCIIVFALPIYFLGKVQNAFFSAIPLVFQEAATTTSSVWADSLFPALAENLFTFILVSFMFTWSFRTFYAKNKGMYWIVNVIIIPVVFAGLWMLFHWARYGASEMSLTGVFFFALIGMIITMTTMSAIPYFILHFLTNFMLSLRTHGLMSNDTTTWILTLAVFFALILFIVFYVLDKSSDKAATPATS